MSGDVDIPEHLVFAEPCEEAAIALVLYGNVWIGETHIRYDTAVYGPPEDDPPDVSQIAPSSEWVLAQLQQIASTTDGQEAARLMAQLVTTGIDAGWLTDASDSSAGWVVDAASPPSVIVQTVEASR